MLNELLDKIRLLSKRKQRAVLALGMIGTILGFMSALPEWTDAYRPSFLGACGASIIKDCIAYLLGNTKEDRQHGDISDVGD